MPQFHGYPLDDEGKIIGRQDFTAPDDLEAMRVARELITTVALEVWCGTRIVGQLDRNEAPSQRRILKDANQN